MPKQCQKCYVIHKDYSKLQFIGYQFKPKTKKRAIGACYNCGCGSTMLIMIGGK